MVFISRGRGRGGNRGRGRGVGEVSFESRDAHSQHIGRDSRQAPESLRITVGNDQFRDRKEDNISGRLSPSVSQRLGPPKENYDHVQEAGYRREDEMYRREAEVYGHPDRDRFERDREHERRDPYNRDPYPRPEEREYGDRRGLGGGGYEQPPADYRAPPAQPLFPSASRSSPLRRYPAPQTTAPSSAQTSTSSRPLKSILKKKPEPVPEHKPPEKPSGLPGIANYMDDIEDEDKFLYGGEEDRRNSNERERRESAQFRQHPHGVPIEDMTATNIRSAAQSWQPSAPEKTVSGVVSDFVNAQREYVDNTKPQQYGVVNPFHSQPMQTVGQAADSGGNDLWSMLAKSVQTVQQQQPPPNQFEPQLGNFQPPFSAQSAQPSFPAKPAQELQEPAASHDPTIENILKSIGFDFEMSKRMQEKAKQSSGEVVPQAPKPGDPKFINQTASFIGSQMSHEEMISTLGTLQREREAQASVVERHSEPIQDDFRETEREMFNNRDRRGSSEASRGRLNSPPRRMNSPPRRMSSPPRGEPPERLQRGCSPVSAEGSPPPPMFNLPPITIKRRPNLDRSRSPGWDKKRSLSRSPTRDSDRSRNRPRSRSPSWNRSLSSFGRKRSRSPVRKQTLSPVSPISQRDRSRSPGGRKSPIIKRTFNLDDLSPAFRRRVSPSARQRSVSPGRRRSPGRRSPNRRSISPNRRRSISPNRRRSISPTRRRSRSPFRRRSRSPMGKRASRSPGRRRSPRRRSPSPRGRRRSISPRGRKRGPSSRSISRERKVRRSTSRDRPFKGSPGRGGRSSSRDRRRRRSRSRSRSHSRSPRKGSRSLSISSDSDIDGPANKQYFSSPLRLSRSLKQNIPRYYDYPPPQGPPPDFNAPPFPGYGPGPGPPPGTFPPGSQPGMVPVGPSGPPMFTMPPPGMGPPMGPPPGFPYPPPSGPPGAVFGMPGPPHLSQPPPITPEPEMAPPGTVEMPLNLPIRSNLTEIVSEESKDSGKKESEHLKEEKKRERSRSRDRRERSRSRDRRERSRSRERRDRSRSRERRQRSRSKERNKDKRDDRRSDKSSSSSNRTVLPPKARPKAEDIEIKASATSNERVVVMGGKTTKLSSSSTREEKKEDPEKEKVKIIKEKEVMVAKIKALESEFNNLKKQEFDLRKRSGKDSKPDPILVENKKLLEEIKKEIVKLTKQKNDFESRHSALFKREQTTKREIKVTAKKTPSKDEKGKSGDKKEKEEVEKGKLMKHYFHDGGDHWCKPCNSIHPNVQDYMHHLSSYKHKQTLPSDFRPWMDGYKANDGMIINKKGIRVPLPGIEFMMPVTAYYCQLCKVFLGDVSFGADHFKCESHYINYKKYLAENPIYEKKYKEERDKVLSANKTSKKLEQERKDKKTKEETKKKNTEKDARVRENEKKWDKSVDNLDDVSGGSKKQEAGKSQIKLSLKDKNQKNETAEKGFGKFNWTKDKTSEEPKNGEKTPEASQEKEKGKINFNISLSGKPGKSFIGKSGAQKKNPLLPPWQPVGKKTETLGKPGETANLDQFLTTNSGEGKIPVISEKKKISAKEILEAFSGKYKDKEVTTVHNEADQAKVTAEKTADKSDVKEKQVLNENTKQKSKEDKDKRLMGIDPESEVPLAEKKPPPPISHNVPLPDQKPSATVDENDVHKVFNTEGTNETEKPVMETVSLSEITLPLSVKDEEIHKPEPEKDIKAPSPEKVVNPDPEKDTKAPSPEKVVKPEPEKDTKSPSPEKVVKQEDAEATNAKSDVVEQTIILKGTIIKAPSPEKLVKQEDAEATIVKSDAVEQTVLKEEKDNLLKSDEVPENKENVTSSEIGGEQELIKGEKIESDKEIKEEHTETKTRLETKTVPEVEIKIETVVSVKEEKEFAPMEIEDEMKQEKVHELKSEMIDAKTEHEVVDSNNEDSKNELTETEKEIDNTEEKSYDSDTEIDEPVSPVPTTRGRGRGRGRKRGRGRGRGKAKTTPARSTRSTRSTKTEEVPEETVETIELEKIKSDSDNVDNSETNKDLELSSSVQVAKTAGGKNKKSASPRTRKTSIKSDSGKMDVEEVSDKEDTLSEASGVSMHMDSDFEVVDDLEDMEVLDEAS